MTSYRRILCFCLTLGLILGTHQGYIALWEEHGQIPMEIYPYKAALLPPEEVSRLMTGIPIRDEEHLQFLLMNFLS